jgi:hypothetical protein
MSASASPSKRLRLNRDSFLDAKNQPEFFQADFFFLLVGISFTKQLGCFNGLLIQPDSLLNYFGCFSLIVRKRII